MKKMVRVIIMYIVVDTETTGLPRQRGQSFKNLNNFNSCRMVSIAWSVLKKDRTLVKKQHHIIKPDSFVIPKFATNIHGISQTMAVEKGKNFDAVMYRMVADILDNECEIVVGHNIYFDNSVICSELYRHGHVKLLNTFLKLDRYCTMIEGKRQGHPAKLCDMYKSVTNRKMRNAHNAMADVNATVTVFKHLMAV
jgi:DNA polymerase III epsilon subunit-like protein